MTHEITNRLIKISGCTPRNEIVQKVVNTFIKDEYFKKGKGIIFRYPVERLQIKEEYTLSDQDIKRISTLK